MKAGADDTPPGEERDEGWDETVLVWNATVARIPAPGAPRDRGGAEGEASERDGPAQEPARRSASP
jgi:hypothetical protein